MKSFSIELCFWRLVQLHCIVRIRRHRFLLDIQKRFVICKSRVHTGWQRLKTLGGKKFCTAILTICEHSTKLRDVHFHRQVKTWSDQRIVKTRVPWSVYKKWFQSVAIRWNTSCKQWRKVQRGEGEGQSSVQRPRMQEDGEPDVWSEDLPGEKKAHHQRATQCRATFLA